MKKSIVTVFRMRNIVVASFLCLAIISCKKDSGDTPKTKTPEEILTGNTWKIDMIRFLQANTPYYYKRGASSGNTANFDPESILFKSDNTGTYTVTASQQHPLTWSFENPEKTIIKFTIQYSTPLLVRWENVVYTETSIKYGEYYTLSNGNNSVAYGTRIPK